VTHPRRWELPAALCCAVLSYAPWAGPPAALFLLCLLPGMAIARHRLGERSIERRLILGSVLSLAAVPALAIPLALVAGRPTHLLAVVSACAVTGIASLRPAGGTAAPAAPLNRRHVALLLLLALLLQAGMTIAMFPDPDTIRWKGLPDLVFFTGIYQQLTLHTPPLDPESGARLLVHNWIYHFHFALVQQTTGLSVWSMMRVVSAWTALTLLGLVYLLATDVLKRPAAGVIACLFLMTSGEAYWLVRSIARMAWSPAPLPWRESPFGITLLFGWYNLPPLAAGLAAWYWFARHIETGRRAPLAASVLMCAVMAFFHPIFFAIFMTGFCLWMAGQALRRRAWRPAWLLFLLTPVPFFLLYKIPYYGLAMPPQVVHAGSSLAGVLRRGEDMILWGGGVLVLGVAGLAVARGAGPLAWIAGISLAARLLLVSPNPHWTNDLAYLALSIGAGIGATALWRRSRPAGLAVAGSVLLAGTVAFAMHFAGALGDAHTFSAGERAAAAWLRDETGPETLVAVRPNSTSTYTVLAAGRRRVTHGWTTHQLDFHHDARRREAEAAELFDTDDPRRAAELARLHQVDYVYVGTYESESAGLRGLSGPCFREVFRDGPIRLLAFTCGQAGEP